MITHLHKTHQKTPTKILSFFITLSFLMSSVVGPNMAYAQGVSTPAGLVMSTPAFMPVMVKAIEIDPKNPLHFGFVVDSGDTGLDGDALTEESKKLIRYFLASLTTPEKDMWVNLSPYEKDRIIADSFGATQMGRDLLEQDYMLKQLTASLIYPEDELGKKFWKKIYKRAYDEFGTTDVPMNTFNKVWIVPKTATVYEHGNRVFVIDSELEVMMEEDYVALQEDRREKLEDRKTKNQEIDPTSLTSNIQPLSSIASQIVREIVIPEIEKEVNTGKNFANLRQVYNAMILATWYKNNLKASLLGQVYVDQSKTKGIEIDDKQANEKIYAQYLQAFKDGVYDYIKVEQDEFTGQNIPRKYFSGGFISVSSSGIPFNEMVQTMTAVPDFKIENVDATGPVYEYDIGLVENQTREIKPPELAVAASAVSPISSAITLKPVAPNTFQIDNEELNNLADRPANLLAAMADESLKEENLVTLQNAGGRAFVSAVNEIKNILNQIVTEFDENAPLPDMPLINILKAEDSQYGPQMQFALKSNPEKVFVLTLKRTKDGEETLRVIPQKTVLLYGAGTIASKVGQELKRLGLTVIGANRSANKRARDAVKNFDAAVPLNAAGVAAYEKAGFKVERDNNGNPITADSYLQGINGVQKVDLVVEGLDGKAKVVVDAKGMPIVEAGKVVVKLPADAEEKGYKLADVANSLVYKLEVFDNSTVPVLYQGSNKPKLVSNNFVSETNILEAANISFEYIQGQKNIFIPSCNTTSLITLLAPLLTNDNIVDGSLSGDVVTTRRTADPGSLKNEVGADGFSKYDPNYHHWKDALAMVNQEGVDLTKKLKKVTTAEGKEEFAFVTDASLGPQSKYHQGRAVIDGLIKDGDKERPITANDIKKMLKANGRIALVQSDPLDKMFNATGVFDTQFNNLQIIHPFMSFAWVKQRPDNKVLIIFLTAQESNVIPNNVTTSLLRLGLFNDKDVAAANEEVNLSMELDKIKEGFETYLPATISSTVKTQDVINKIEGIINRIKQQNLTLKWIEMKYNAEGEESHFFLADNLEAFIKKVKADNAWDNFGAMYRGGVTIKAYGGDFKDRTVNLSFEDSQILVDGDSSIIPIANASSGATVNLPAGTFDIGEFIVEIQRERGINIWEFKIDKKTYFNTKINEFKKVFLEEGQTLFLDFWSPGSGDSIHNAKGLYVTQENSQVVIKALKPIGISGNYKTDQLLLDEAVSVIDRMANASSGATVNLPAGTLGITKLIKTIEEGIREGLKSFTLNDAEYSVSRRKNPPKVSLQDGDHLTLNFLVLGQGAKGLQSKKSITIMQKDSKAEISATNDNGNDDPALAQMVVTAINRWMKKRESIMASVNGKIGNIPSSMSSELAEQRISNKLNLAKNGERIFELDSFIINDSTSTYYFRTQDNFWRLVDYTEISSSAQIKNPGGINLDSELLDLQIKRDGNGIPLPVAEQPLDMMNIEGFSFFIMSVTPVSSMFLLSGLPEPKEDDTSLTRASGLDIVEPKARFEAKEIEEVSLKM